MADITVPAGIIPSVNAKFGGKLAAVTILVGQTVYEDSSVNPPVLRLADADLSAAAGVVAGIACNSGTVGQYVRYVIEDPALYLGATMVVGDVLWQSDAAGGITITRADLEAGDYITLLGVCSIVNSTVNMKLIPAGAVVA